MYRAVLLPLDGSQFSEQALPLASTLAKRCGAQLKVVHVHEPHTEPDWDEITPFRYEGVEKAEREWNGNAIRLEQEYLVNHIGADCKVVEGSVVQCLEEEITESDPDLIVMATHGRSGISRAWIGSVADNLVRHIHKPILLIRAREDEQRDVELRTDKVTYAFADPALEGLSGAQRQLLRMGPRNVRIVQAKLREVAGFLGIPDALLPPPDAPVQ